jgi:hypothetical protein
MEFDDIKLLRACSTRLALPRKHYLYFRTGFPVGFPFTRRRLGAVVNGAISQGVGGLRSHGGADFCL